MDLQAYVRLLRKGWRLVVAVTLLVVAVAALLTVLTPKQYQSTLQFFVSTADSTDTSQLAQGSTFTQQRVKSYQQLLTTPKVLAPVISALHLTTTPEALSQRVTATVPPDTVLINVVVRDASPAGAAAIAGKIATEFPKSVAEIERVSDKSPSPVKITVVQPALVDLAPIAPRPTRNLGLGLVLGLLLGGGLAVLRATLDNRVRDKSDVEAVTDAPVVGAIPFDSDAPKHPLIVQADPHSTRAEAFRSLRTNLQFLDVANHPRVIVVTSSLAGEGKTTTTANLALTLAQSGARVCLIEGDLRRPRLLDYLGLEGAVGITDVLIGRVALRDVIQPFGSESLSVIGAGALPPNPSELLGSTAMRDVVQQLQGLFDYVLVDAPPLLPVTDAAILSTFTGGAVMVAGSGIVTRDQLATAIGSLESVNGRVLGVVLNRIPRSAAGGYYDYSYQTDAQKALEADAPRRRRDRVDAPTRRERTSAEV